MIYLIYSKNIQKLLIELVKLISYLVKLVVSVSLNSINFNLTISIEMNRFFINDLNWIHLITLIYF